MTSSSDNRSTSTSPERSCQTCCWNRDTDHITPVLRSLHWLSIRLRIQYKLFMHLVRVGRSPAYLADMMTATADLLGRERLRSAASSFRYEIPQLKLKFGERSFSYTGPKTWNPLPSNLQKSTNTDTTLKKTIEYSPV